MSSFSCCCRFSIFSNPESQKQEPLLIIFFFYKVSKNISECTGVIISDCWASFRIQPVEIWRNHDNPFLRCMHYLHTLQWSQQLCWLPPQPWWGCFSVHQEPPGPPESLSLTAGCRRAGSRFVAPSTPPADYSKITNEMKGKWLLIQDSLQMVQTWSFLPLIVKLLMAHAASFCVPKSPCLEKPRYMH